MYDENSKTISRANFLKLREQCFLLVRNQSVSSVYSEIIILSEEHKEFAKTADLGEVGRSFYEFGNKIAFIRIILMKYEGMGLKEAKMMADGYWADFKASDEHNN